MNPDP